MVSASSSLARVRWDGGPLINSLSRLLPSEPGAQILVCRKIEVTSPADLNQVVAIIDSVEMTVLTLVPDTLTVYVEPDVYDPIRVDAPWT